jgi:hypothetical protein
MESQMRAWPGLPLIFLAAACSPQETEESSQDLRTFEVSESAADVASAPPSPPPPAQAGRSAGPDISPTAAPGVAFNYRYAFRLPAQRVDQVQEQHARTCEQLGINRCRITGMRYRVDRDGDIEGMLAFKLEPTIARRFGRNALEAVLQAEGMLVDAEISGTDVGSSIRSATRNIGEMTEELERIEARLARGGVPSGERTRLEYEADQLRQSIRATRTNREANEESLAAFHYGSGELAPGFEDDRSFAQAAKLALDNFVEALLILFIVFVTLVPWLLIGALAWWIVRRIRRRSPRAAGAETKATADLPEASPKA